MHNSWILIGNLLSGKYKLLLLRDVIELLVTSYTTEIAEVLIKKKVITYSTQISNTGRLASVTTQMDDQVLTSGMKP